jgi:hypothetical protein
MPLHVSGITRPSSGASAHILCNVITPNSICTELPEDNNIYLLQMGCHPVAVITLHVFLNTATKFT